MAVLFNFGAFCYRLDWRISFQPDTQCSYAVILFLWTLSFEALDVQIIKENPGLEHDYYHELKIRIFSYIGFIIAMIVAFIEPILCLTIIFLISLIKVIVISRRNKRNDWIFIRWRLVLHKNQPLRQLTIGIIIGIRNISSMESFLFYIALGIKILKNHREFYLKSARIPNLDLNRETDKIIYYQREMSHHTPGSIRYNEAKRLFNVWFTKLINKRNDYYDKMTAYIVRNSYFVAVQNENIIAWKNNKYLSHGIQLNAPRIFMDKLEYKCDWNDVIFIKIPRNFPSTQICSNCQRRNRNIRGLDKLGIRDWDCPFCGKHHDRDVNASINILNRGLELVGTTGQ